LAEHSRCPCPYTPPCLQDPGRALTMPHHHPPSCHRMSSWWQSPG
jgi:hypothetical protein